MLSLTRREQKALLNAIANREASAKSLAKEYGCTVSELREFVEDNEEAINRIRDKEANQDGELWIVDKTERIRRYQEVVDELLEIGLDSTTLREIRSYMRYVAEELGQLKVGSAEDGASVSYTFTGVDMDDLS